MGSSFIDFARFGSGKFSTMQKLFGASTAETSYVQFIPGIVTHVVTSTESGAYDKKKNTRRQINSILAKQHFGTKLRGSSSSDDTDRYYPLMRGMADIPVAGDPVLLCTMGGVQYYLGPLNTANSPTWNIDHLNFASKDAWPDDIKRQPPSDRDKTGLSKNFVIEPSFSRLQKMYNEQLDNPTGDKISYHDIHGDLVFEGRHGNSIRIGSRHVNPYIVISNKRPPGQETESTFDGSVMGMFAIGSVHQHFPADKEIKEDEIVESPFVLGSDKVVEGTKRKRLMSDLVSHVNQDIDADKIIYQYSNEISSTKEDPNVLGSHIFLNSDRVVINSRKDSLFLSSFSNIHLGASNTLTISTEKEMIVESSEIFFGKQAKDYRSGLKIVHEEDVRQGMILGENLREWLEALTEVLIQSNSHQHGAPTPLGYHPDDGIGGLPGSQRTKLRELKEYLTKDVNDIVSIHHFIEDNQEDKNVITEEEGE